jgi:hypothetical protein
MSMKSVNIEDARKILGDLVDRARIADEQVLITRYNKAGRRPRRRRLVQQDDRRTCATGRRCLMTAVRALCVPTLSRDGTRGLPVVTSPESPCSVAEDRGFEPRMALLPNRISSAAP